MHEQPNGASEKNQPGCPHCGDPKPLRIAYGYPTQRMFEALERGELALGGCVISSDSPTWRCRACRREWGGPPKRIDGVAAFIPGSPS